MLFTSKRRLTVQDQIVALSRLDRPMSRGDMLFIESTVKSTRLGVTQRHLTHEQFDRIDRLFTTFIGESECT